MKKRILIIGVVLALILTLVAPAAAYAKPSYSFVYGEFTAEAELRVTHSGHVEYQLFNDQPVAMTTTGEVIQGNFVSSTWPEAAGASIKVTHNSVVTFSLDGTFQGYSYETVVVKFTNNKKLTGYSTTTIQGLYNSTGIISVSDDGYFTLSGAGTGAWGNWSADFAPGQGTLIGDGTFNGTYYSYK